MNKTILFLILLCSFSVFADQQYFNADTPADVKVFCEYDGASCASSTLCNLSVFGENSIPIVDNKQMNKTSNYYNYTLSGLPVGEYSARAMCYNTTVAVASNFDIEVNNLGGNREYGKILLFLVLIMFIFLAIVEAYALIYRREILRLIMLIPLSGVFSMFFFFLYQYSISLTHMYWGIFLTFVVVTIGISCIVIYELVIMLLSAKKRAGVIQDTL